MQYKYVKNKVIKQLIYSTYANVAILILHPNSRTIIEAPSKLKAVLCTAEYLLLEGKLQELSSPLRRLPQIIFPIGKSPPEYNMMPDAEENTLR